MRRVFEKNIIRKKVRGNILLLLVLFVIVTGIPVFARDTYGRPETIRLQASDYRTDLKAVRDQQGNILVPLQDSKTVTFLERYNCHPTFLVPMDTIVLGLPGGNDLRLVLGEKQMTSGDKTIPLKTGAVVINGEPYIPLEVLERACGFKSVYDETTRTFCLAPLVSDVVFTCVDGKLALDIITGRPVTYTTSTLKEPDRFVIDIDGAIADETLEEKDIHDPSVGNLFISQESLNPNKVRIIIPLEKGINVVMAPPVPDQPLIRANIQQNYEVFTGFYDQERISDLRVVEQGDYVTFKILTTGPVQYEWRRLVHPDNRYFVDIPACLYTAPRYHKEFDVGYLKSIDVQQLRPLPEPVVRVTLELHVPSKVDVGPDEKYPGELHITVYSRTINPGVADRQGFGISEVVPGMPRKVITPGSLTICIDPGHGGGDPGACYSNLAEKDINLDIGFRLAKLLRRTGWNVVMTRTVDRDVTYAGSPDSEELSARVEVAHRANADIFVSIHNNASAGGGGQGTAVYYYKDNSTLLAQHVNRYLIQANGRYNEGVLHGSFYVIRGTRMPAVLVECAYLSNPTEAGLLGTPEFRQKCAQGIFNGIVSYAQSRGLKGGGQEMIVEPEETLEEQIQKKKLKALDEELKKHAPEGSGEYRER